jgi:undecaprenyl-diphosphatase
VRKLNPADLPLVSPRRFEFKQPVPDWIVAILLGIVEGVTEFLPVSSTGHLLLVEHWLQDPAPMFKTDLFNVVIQGGAVLAVVIIFQERLRQLFFQWREPATQRYWLKLMVAFAITAAGGLALKALKFKLPETVAPVAWATLIGGVLFLLVESWLRRRTAQLEVTWAIAIAMGAAQLVAAVFPGTSRSGITILVALVMGLARPQAAEFAFLLGIPTLLAAGAVQVLGEIRAPSGVPMNWSLILLAGIAAAITAFIVVKWLLRFVQTHTFVVFGWYRIVLGGALLLFAWKWA